MEKAMVTQQVKFPAIYETDVTLFTTAR